MTSNISDPNILKEKFVKVQSINKNQSNQEIASHQLAEIGSSSLNEVVQKKDEKSFDVKYHTYVSNYNKHNKKILLGCKGKYSSKFMF
jgi:hypothetical protein